jgi:septal ring factor EnvC (AmiA/AmiB activator)
MSIKKDYNGENSMDGELEFTIIITIASGVAGLYAVLLARQISTRLRKRTLKERDLKGMVAALRKDLENYRLTISEKDREIEYLKSELGRKDKEIADLREQIKVTEKVSEKDYNRILERLMQISAMLKELRIATEEKEEKK